jgi:hypothetical protein
MKRSEMILLSLFVLTAAVALTYKLWQLFSQRLEDLVAREHSVEMRQAETDVYLERRDLWLARMKWLKTTQPAMGPADQVDNELVNLARAPSVAGVTTEKLKLVDPVENASYKQAGIEFIAKGKLKDIFSWLHSLQKPEEFRAIRRLKVNPDPAAPDKVVCEVQLLRWYAAKSAAGS